MSWAERAADRSPLVHRSRARSIAQAKSMVDAARRLVEEKGERFTTQELVKEAGVALQTFYRHFEGKDQLLLAVLEDTIAEGAAHFEAAARHLPDPLDRLHYYVTAVMEPVQSDDSVAARFITSEHWRLHQLFPQEMAYITRPVTDLLLRDINEARSLGLLYPVDAERGAWLMTRLLMATFHHYAFATRDEGAETITADVWAFCLNALGLKPNPAAKERREADRRSRGDRTRTSDS